LNVTPFRDSIVFALSNRFLIIACNI